jgi:hypothetical protein
MAWAQDVGSACWTAPPDQTDPIRIRHPHGVSGRCLRHERRPRAGVSTDHCSLVRLRSHLPDHGGRHAPGDGFRGLRFVGGPGVPGMAALRLAAGGAPADGPGSCRLTAAPVDPAISRPRRPPHILIDPPWLPVPGQRRRRTHYNANRLPDTTVRADRRGGTGPPSRRGARTARREERRPGLSGCG